MRLVYICSPQHGKIEKAVQQAQEYCEYAAGCGTIPLSPHIIFSPHLDDQRMGLELLKRCDELWVMGADFSEGMRSEMKLAAAEHIPVLYVPDSFVQCGYKIRQEDTAFTASDCIPGSNQMDYKHQILVLKPEAHRMGPRMTADDSLWLAGFGNGCTFGAMGRMVMATSLLSGERVHWERQDFFGIVSPDRLLEWSADKPVCNDRAREILDLAEQEISPVPEQDEGMEL